MTPSRRLFPLAVVLASLALALPAQAANLTRSYAYFSIGGSTLQELEVELALRGPEVSTSGKRHPGATQLEFAHRVSTRESGGRCRIAKASVSVTARIILPRWTTRARGGRETRLIWDTLAADIKRHEESHVGIARNHARLMEEAATAVPAQKSCALAKAKADAAIRTVMARHDSEQARFDRIEGLNFEARIERLLRYRIQQIESGRLPG